MGRIRPLPGDDREGPRPVGESIDRWLAMAGGPAAPVLRTLFADWSDLVGPAIAEHAHPRRLVDGTLLLAVDEPAWATQLKWLESDLLGRLAEAVGPGVVQRIEVAVRPRQR